MSRIAMPAELRDGPTAVRPWRDSDVKSLVSACQDTEIATAVSPVRTTLKVNGVDPPLLPSSLLADCNPISSAAGGGQEMV